MEETTNPIKSELETRMIKYLDKLESAVDAGADMAAEALPETIVQFLNYKFWENMFWIVFFTFLFFGLLTLLIKFTTKAMEYNKTVQSDEDPQDIFNFICSLVFGIGTFVTFINFCSNVPYLIAENIKIYFAPNVYVLEYLKELIN